MATSDGLSRGVELFNRGLYWEAHEAWEEAWTPARHGPWRALYKGLIQVAAGCLHYHRGNRRGALNKWRSGTDLLRSHGLQETWLDLEGLVAEVDRLAARLQAAKSWPALELPLIGRKPATG